MAGWGPLARATRWLPRLVAGIPAGVHAKLLIGFLVIVGLLVAVGAVGLEVLSGANRRAENLVSLQRKIAAYRQLQHDTTAQLYTVASALLVPDDRTFEATLRQLNQFGYDLDRLQFVAKDEVELHHLLEDVATLGTAIGFQEARATCRALAHQRLPARDTRFR